MRPMSKDKDSLAVKKAFGIERISQGFKKEDPFEGKVDGNVWIIKGKKLLKRKISKCASKTAGTWSNPDSASKVSQLVKIWKKLNNGEWPSGKAENFSDTFYDLMGDDKFLDRLESLKGYYLKGVAEAMRETIGEWIKNGPETWRDKQDYGFISDIGKKIGLKVDK